jgi:phosphatidate cytidylyltransferase
MLKQRVITASILAPLAIAAVLWLPTTWLGIVLTLILLLAAEEWTKLSGLSSCGAYVGFLAAISLTVMGIGWLLVEKSPLWPLFLPAGLWWLVTALRLPRIKEIPLRDGPDWPAFVSGLLVLSATWGGLLWVHQLSGGPVLMLALLFLIWGADIAAYFTGKRWGRRKLAPVLSPGKSIEGVMGAMAAGLAMGVLLAAFYGQDPLQQAGLLLLCLILVPVSVVGDLYESLLKRERGLKDSGNLLPGHGGVLDRIDSLTAAAPVFALGLWLLGVPA